MAKDISFIEFISSLDPLEQIILLESYSEETQYQVNLMAHFLDVDEDILINLQKKVKAYLNEIEEVFDENDMIILDNQEEV